MAYVQGEDRKQITLFPESIDEYITEDSVVRIIDEYVNQLDVKKLGFKFAECPTVGRPPYDPRDMIKIYVYGYLNRVRSSRRLEHEALRNIEVMWLLKKVRPDFKTISDFRKDNKKALKGVFRDFNTLCDSWGLFGKEMVAIDGSKFRAVNSKKNNFSGKKIDRLLGYIDERINRYMQELEEQDQVEDEAYKKPSVKEIEQRLQELRNRKEKYEGYNNELKEKSETELSTTDPDARLMSSNNNGVDMAYNIQTTVDAKHKLVADYKVTTDANDIGELDNMALRARKLFGGLSLKCWQTKGITKPKT